MQRRLLFLFTAGSLCAAFGLAQTTGSIGGWIVDSSGAALSGVAIEAVSPSLQGRRSAVTAKDGTYRVPALPPGRYTLRTSLPGFASVERGVTVTADSTSIARMILQLALSEKVSVSGESPFVEMTSTTTGTSYDQRLLIHLPLDRNYADGIRNNPGVVQDLGATQGRSLALAIDGATSAENQWIIDGIDTTNVLKGVQGKAINNEFVEEVEVKTGGYQAEYGRALGGVINVVTRSGGNAFHGDGFVYYDSSALAARRDFVEGVDSSVSGMRLADYSRTDYGIDLGGYLLKDRLWFFGAYNRTELPAKVSRFTSSALVPDTMEFPLDGIDSLYSIKLTWAPTGGSTLVATVFGDPTTNSGAGAADPRQGVYRLPEITNPDPGTWESKRTVGAADYGLRFEQVFGSSGLFTLQAARHQDRYELTTSGAGLQTRFADYTCEGGTPAAPCVIPPAPNFVQGGFGQLGGPGNTSSSHRDQLRADVNLYRGSHDVRFGADYQNAQTHAVGLFSGGQQVFRFNERGQTYYLHQFYAENQGVPPVAVNANWVASAQEVGVYAQDSWKAAHGLTINAGLRWDEERIRDRAGSSGILLQNEWQPRLGVVWDPWQDGTTKLYAFAGRFYNSLAVDLVARGWGGPVASVTYNFDPVDLAPADVPGHPSILYGTPVNIFVTPPVDPGLKGISLDEFTAGAERLVGQTFSLGIKATYRRLHNTIEDRCDLDPRVSNAGSCAIVNPGSSGQYARGAFYYCNGLDISPNCTADAATYVPLYGTAPTPPARRLYRAIELLARKSFSERLWFQGSYVYSSLRGNYDGLVSEGFYGETSPGINPDFDLPGMYRNGYGRLFLDRPQALRVAGFYTTPFRLSAGLEAWAASGAPLNKLGYLNQNYPYDLQLVPKGYAGRMPATWDANLTLEYPVHVGLATVTLQAYVYNLFNNQIRTSQDTVWSNQQPACYPDCIFDPNQGLNSPSNPNYGLITRRQPPRLFRAAVRVSL
jgi:hypothetical protein